MTIDMGSLMSSAAEQESTNQSEGSTDDKEKWIVHLASSKIGDKIVHLLNSSLNVRIIMSVSIGIRSEWYRQNATDLQCLGIWGTLSLFWVLTMAFWHWGFVSRLFQVCIQFRIIVAVHLNK